MLTTERLETIPMAGIVERVRASGPRTVGITVPALPTYPFSATIEGAVQLADAGYEAIPHFAATQIGDRRSLERILERLSASAVDSLFLFGGEGAALLALTRVLTQGRFRLGVAAYPMERSAFDDETGLRILAGKAVAADFAVTQLWFDAERIARFAGRAVDRGIALPRWIGVPGRVRLTRLLSIAARIGVGPSLRFAGKRSNRRFLGSSGAEGCAVASLGWTDDLGTTMAGFHICSFNDLGLEVRT